MNIFKKALSAIILCALSLSMASCGGEPDTGPSPISVRMEPALERIGLAGPAQFSEGLSYAYMEIEGKIGYCFVDAHGEIVLGPYDGYTASFSEGLAVIRMGDKAGIIDKSGNVVVPVIYDSLNPWHEGYAVGSLDHKRGILDMRDYTFMQYDCLYIENVSEGLACVCVIESGMERYGFIDPKSGNEIVPLIYDIAFGFSEGLSCVRKDGKYGYMDTSGNEVIPLAFEDAKSFSEGLAAVKIDGKYGYIDKTGTVVIEPKYEGASPFREGVAGFEIVYAIGKPNGHGLINAAGEEAVAPIYDWISDFHEGFAAVLKDGKRGYIDKAGVVVIPLQYELALDFSEGFAAVRKNGKYGYIDASGEEVVPFQYDMAYPFSEGHAWVEQGNKWGILQVAEPMTEMENG